MHFTASYVKQFNYTGYCQVQRSCTDTTVDPNEHLNVIGYAVKLNIGNALSIWCWNTSTSYGQYFWFLCRISIRCICLFVEM